MLNVYSCCSPGLHSFTMKLLQSVTPTIRSSLSSSQKTKAFIKPPYIKRAETPLYRECSSRWRPALHLSLFSGFSCNNRGLDSRDLLLLLYLELYSQVLLNTVMHNTNFTLHTTHCTLHTTHCTPHTAN